MEKTKIHIEKNGYWTELTDIDVARTAGDGDLVVYRITVELTDVTGVRIEYLDGNISDHKYAPKLYELQVFGE